jgi:hypothetical protein
VVNVAHEVTYGVLYSLLSLRKMGIMKCKLLQVCHTRFQETEWQFIGCIMQSVYSLIQTRPCYRYGRESSVGIVTRL